MTAQDLLKPPTRYKLTIADYLALDRSGAFEGRRKQLIGGEIIVMNPQYRRHGFVKDELAYRLRRALEGSGSDIGVAVEVSVEVTDHDMPQLDITLTREPDGKGAIPMKSVCLIVEVADTSLDFDLNRKAGLYAAAGVPEYWVADVNGRVNHQMWRRRLAGTPSGGRWLSGRWWRRRRLRGCRSRPKALEA